MVPTSLFTTTLIQILQTMAINKKQLMARIMVPAIRLGLSHLRTSFFSHIPVLAYHRILDLPDENSYEFDIELISASTSGFEQQMNYLKMNFNPVTFRQIIDAAEGKQTLPKRPVVITFDDGFDDNYHYAYPVLRKLGIPATIFISTSYIDQAKPFWFDWIAYMIVNQKVLGEDIFEHNIKLDISNLEQRRKLLSKVLDHLKKISNDERLEFIQKLKQSCDIKPPEDGFKMSKALTWVQVEEMARNNIEFGSHTVNHPILTSITNDNELDYELIESKKSIEEHIGQDVQVISYPVGGAASFDERVCEASKRAGYKLGVSYISGVNKEIAINDFDIKRIHVEHYTTMPDFMATLTLPELFA